MTVEVEWVLYMKHIQIHLTHFWGELALRGKMSTFHLICSFWRWKKKERSLCTRMCAGLYRHGRAALRWPCIVALHSWKERRVRKMTAQNADAIWQAPPLRLPLHSQHQTFQLLFSSTLNSLSCPPPICPSTLSPFQLSIFQFWGGKTEATKGSRSSGIA